MKKRSLKISFRQDVFGCFVGWRGSTLSINVGDAAAEIDLFFIFNKYNERKKKNDVPPKIEPTTFQLPDQS